MAGALVRYILVLRNFPDLLLQSPHLKHHKEDYHLYSLEILHKYFSFSFSFTIRELSKATFPSWTFFSSRCSDHLYGIHSKLQLYLQVCVFLSGYIYKNFLDYELIAFR